MIKIQVDINTWCAECGKSLKTHPVIKKGVGDIWVLPHDCKIEKKYDIDSHIKYAKMKPLPKKARQ